VRCKAGVEPLAALMVYFPKYLIFFKLPVDAVSNLLIMRTTSSDNGTKNSLRINELDSSVTLKVLRSPDRQR